MIHVRAFNKQTWTNAIETVQWLKHFCNISMYPSFVMRIPDDGYMSGWNM